MADNSSIPVAVGNETFANHDIGGIKYPRVRLTWGPSGTTNDADVATGKPIPIQLRGSDGTDRSNLLPVSGTVTANQGGAPWSVTMTSTTITGSVAVTQSGTWNIGSITTLPALPTGTNNIGDVDVLTMPAITGTVTATLNAETTKVIGVTRTADGAGNLLTSVTRGAQQALSTQLVDASGNQITSFGGGTQYTEDVAAATDPIGNMLIAVRRDTLSISDVSADGDNIALKSTNKGKLHVAAELRLGDVVADVGAGTGGTATQRIIIDSAQLGSLVNGSVPTITGGFEYETVAASATAQALGATGATGDYLEQLVCVVATAATSQVQIKDGSDAAITVFPNNPGAGIGTYNVAIGLRSRTGAWQVTTGAGVSVLATGDFT